MLVAALFRLVDSIKAFPLIYILTDGGPGTLDRGDQLLLLHPGLQFLLSRLFERDHRDAGRRHGAGSWAIIRLVGWGQRVD